jgi:hypothetical protein
MLVDLRVLSARRVCGPARREPKMMRARASRSALEGSGGGESGRDCAAESDFGRESVAGCEEAVGELSSSA